MPIRPAVANVVKHQLMFLCDTEWAVTTLFVQHTVAIDAALVAQDQDRLRQWADASWKPRASNVASLRQIKSWSLATVPPTKFDTSELYPFTHVTGTQSAERSWQINPVLSLRTGLTTDDPKPPSGRIYHVGFGYIASSQADGQITGAEQSALKAAYDLLRTTWFPDAATFGRWVIVSYYDGGTREAPVLRIPPLVIPVARVYLRTRPGVQRRRQYRQQSFPTN